MFVLVKSMSMNLIMRLYDLGEISECTVVASVAEAAVFGFGK